MQPIRRGYRLACCDCGLVHSMNFRVSGGKAQFAAFRDNRATAAIRRAPHNHVSRELYDTIAAHLLKITGKSSLKVGRYRIRFAKAKK